MKKTTQKMSKVHFLEDTSPSKLKKMIKNIFEAFVSSHILFNLRNFNSQDRILVTLRAHPVGICFYKESFGSSFFTRHIKLYIHESINKLKLSIGKQVLHTFQYHMYYILKKILISKILISYYKNSI